SPSVTVAHTDAAAAPAWIDRRLPWLVIGFLGGRADGDEAFLDAVVPFWCRQAGGEQVHSSTVRQRALLAWPDLAERIGVGDRGLVRVGSGDWSDPISAIVPDRAQFRRRGESTFNTGFAAWVLPRAAALLEGTHPGEAAEMRSWAEARRDAMASAWNGHWFLRGTDGHGGPVGDDHLFLDAQV
ncbi:MAG: hypothetical protein JJU45_00545, partial [Acidimicrobiia bacterium]|nr:hypothetical protein [Acidimicrobiia bacterium]